MTDEVETLRAAILARHATIYAFCKKTGLPRGTVYQVMRRRSAGNAETQVTRIRAALEGASESGPDSGGFMKALAALACAACEHGKRACRKKRHVCRELWQAQADAIRELVTGGNADVKNY